MTRYCCAIAWLALGLELGGCSAPAPDTLTEFVSCESSRPTLFRMDRELYGATSVVADGDRGFALVELTSRTSDVVRLSHDGKTVKRTANPSSYRPNISDVAALRDGRLLLIGTAWGDAQQGWVGCLSNDGQLDWEALLPGGGGGRRYVRPLSDGGAMVVRIDPNISTSDPNAEVTVTVVFARLSAVGEVLWERRANAAGTGASTQWYYGRTLSLGADERARFVVETHQGLVLLTSDLDGKELTEQVLDTRLAMYPVAAVGLPDGKLAIATNRANAILTLVDVDGSVLWERAYDLERQGWADALTYDAARGQLVIGGRLAGGSWLLAVDLDGEPVWSLERDPVKYANLDEIGELAANDGPEVAQLVAAPDGTLLAAGWTHSELSYFVVGTEACHD